MADEKPITFHTPSGHMATLVSVYDSPVENTDATEQDLEAAGFVRASRLAAAEAEVERGMGIAQGQQIGYEVQLSSARGRIAELEAHVSLQRETVETGQRYVSELESKLAAAEAMRDAAMEELLLTDWREDMALRRVVAILRGESILASRPSEQASKEGSECPQCLCGKHPADPVCAACALENMASKAQELETQLAEAKADFSNACDVGRRLEARLEAAEAARAHLHATLEAVRVIHPSTVAKVEAAATEDPKPASALCIHCLKPVHEGRCWLPNPQGADYIHRRELTALLRSLGATEVAKQCETGVFGPVGKNP